MKNALPARAQLADRAFLLDITERRVQQLAQQGILVPEKRGYYYLAESVRGYIGYLRKQNERPAPEAALQQWAKALASLETE